MSDLFSADQFEALDTWLAANVPALGEGALIAEFVATLFEEGAPRVIVDPNPANAAAIRCYEKVGFRRLGPIQTPDGEMLLMAIDEPEEEIVGDDAE